MKLFYSPNACSLSPHIVLRESGLPFELVKVDLKTKKTASGDDFWNINPKGYVPVIMLETKDVLTEGVAIVQYIADLTPKLKLAPMAGTMERYHLLEWLNFISTEVHKMLGVFFKSNLPEETKKLAQEAMKIRFDYIDKHLSKNTFIMGDQFTVADAYMFTVVRWTHFFKVDLKPWPNLAKYMENINQRPKVQEALRAEETGK